MSAPALGLESQSSDEFATVARYRLSLVREEGTLYSGVSCGAPEAAAAVAHQILLDFDREAMGALLVDTRNRAIGYTVAYVGTLSRTAVEPRGLLVPALLANAAGVVLFHNHPSGDPSPSPEDLVFTRRVAAAAEVLGVRLLDHLVLGEAPTFVSLQRRGGW